MGRLSQNPWLQPRSGQTRLCVYSRFLCNYRSVLQCASLVNTLAFIQKRRAQARLFRDYFMFTAVVPQFQLRLSMTQSHCS